MGSQLCVWLYAYDYVYDYVYDYYVYDSILLFYLYSTGKEAEKE